MEPAEISLATTKRERELEGYFLDLTREHSEISCSQKIDFPTAKRVSQFPSSIPLDLSRRNSGTLPNGKGLHLEIIKGLSEHFLVSLRQFLIDTPLRL